MSEGQRFLTAYVQGQTFLLDQQTGRFYKLGGTGGQIWGLLSGGATTETAAQTISERTGAPYEQVLEDVQRFVNDLTEAGVLEPQAEAVPAEPALEKPGSEEPLPAETVPADSVPTHPAPERPVPATEAGTGNAGEQSESG